MFGAILKATNSSFQKGMTFCCSIYVKKVMKLLAFIFEQPSLYNQTNLKHQGPSIKARGSLKMYTYLMHLDLSTTQHWEN